MKKFFKFMLFSFLFILFLAILVISGYWMIYIQGVPWWIFTAIAGGALGILLGVSAIRRYLIRRNEKRFVRQVIREESSGVSSSQAEVDQGMKGMEDQWRRSVAMLRRSHLRNRGNPLYVLPWFLIMGETGSGKSTAIKNTNLSSPLTDVSQTSLISGTPNCDWWFFERSIILDIAGRYIIPKNESVDKAEFELFLTLLSQHRKKEPLNGILVAISADSLLNEDELALGEKSRMIRRRINQIMRVVGAAFPVYILVTKMDMIPGFTDFCEHMDDRKESQTMGYLNAHNDPDPMKVLNTGMESLFQGMGLMRTSFIQNRMNSFAVLFPTSFMKLEKGLRICVNTLFGQDTYQATPHFRGFYFSSAYPGNGTSILSISGNDGSLLSTSGNDGSLLSTPGNGTSILSTPGNDGSLLSTPDGPLFSILNGPGISHPGQESSQTRYGRHPGKAFFLKNLFHTILPGDRNLFTPITEFIMWRRRTIGFGVFSIMVIILALCQLLTLSYYHNIKALGSFDRSAFISGAPAPSTPDAPVGEGSENRIKNSTGDVAKNNSTGDSAKNNRAGDSVKNNSAGDSVKNNRAGDSVKNNSAGDSVKNNRAGD
ncbi:MAG: hypothetical protein HQK66_13695, partial [Desulfamplus sp.]|nr:hypothetical protein [Desulfamplus sp.]